VDCVQEGGGYDTQIINFKARDGTELEGVSILAGARVAVVFANEEGTDICSWMPYVYLFTGARGPQIVLFNLPDTAGLTDYLDAAADEARERGAEAIILVGASIGGTASLITAARRADTVAVVTLSPPRHFEDLDALAAVERLAVPLLIVAARRDSQFPADAKLLHRAASAPVKRLMLVDGFQHGTDLLQDDNVVERVARFVFLIRDTVESP
jgi:dienelactone hydrolase